jgi:hypothetical protein
MVVPLHVRAPLDTASKKLRMRALGADSKFTSKKLRSKVGNGRLLPAFADGRSALARRFKDLVQDFAGDLGGMSELSTAEIQVIRRASMLSAQCEDSEALAAQGDKFDPVVYVTMTNAMNRCFQIIGVKRRSRDCTPKLSDYLEAKVAIEPEAPVEAAE